MLYAGSWSVSFFFTESLQDAAPESYVCEEKRRAVGQRKVSACVNSPEVSYADNRTRPTATDLDSRPGTIKLLKENRTSVKKWKTLL